MFIRGLLIPDSLGVLSGEYSGFRVLGGESAVLHQWLILLMSSLVAAPRDRALCALCVSRNWNDDEA